MRTRGNKPKQPVQEIKQTKKSKQQKPTKSVQKNKTKKNKIEQEKKQKPVEVQQQQKKQQPKQQEKKMPNPKKYLKKNYDQLSRIARSKYQKIYLLEAEREQQCGWSFIVQGASGSNYRVSIHHTGLSCSCVDFRMKKKPCKHIYFAVTQVAQNNQLLDYFNNTLKISKAAYTVLDDQLLKRLKSRMQAQKKQDKQIDLKDDTDCTICFTQMDKNTQSLQDCSTCKKYFHVECLNAWKKHNPTCPLCRSALMRKNISDPLGKLSNINISSQNDAN